MTQDMNYEYLLQGKPTMDEVPVEMIEDDEQMEYCMQGTGFENENESYKTSSGDLMYIIATGDRILIRVSDLFDSGAEESIRYNDIKHVGFESYFSKGMKQNAITITTINRQFKFAISAGLHKKQECKDMMNFISDRRRNRES